MTTQLLTHKITLSTGEGSEHCWLSVGYDPQQHSVIDHVRSLNDLRWALAVLRRFGCELYSLDIEKRVDEYGRATSYSIYWRRFSADSKDGAAMQAGYWCGVLRAAKRFKK